MNHMNNGWDFDPAPWMSWRMASEAITVTELDVEHIDATEVGHD